MGLIERVAEEIAGGITPFRRHDVEAEAQRLLAIESPVRPGYRADLIVDSLIGFGPIEQLLRDPAVTDVLVNGHQEIWLEREGELKRSDLRFTSREHLQAAIERVLAPLGLRVDRSSPFVDARLPDGSRLHVVVEPASVEGPVVAVRRFTQALEDLDDLLRDGSASQTQINALKAIIERRATVLISGGTGTGKTTLLNVLASLIPEEERIVTIEDAAELSLPGHVVRLEARPPNAEGAGEVTIRSLVRSALRLRPDRIIVGEVRGPEALDLVNALNTGHRGSLSTIHANSPEEALWRLETLALSAGSTSQEAVRRQMHAAIDVVVQMARSGPLRRISEIQAFDAEGEAGERW